MIHVERGRTPGISFGPTRETGVWRASKSRRKLLWRGHDSLFIALGHWRLRIMKPGR